LLLLSQSRKLGFKLFVALFKLCVALDDLGYISILA
jgi:hypothetical protein